jgi:hypothetical protein
MQAPHVITHVEVVAGFVQKASVVPDDDVACPPLVSVDELGLRRVFEELLEERASFFHRHPLDMGGMVSEIQALAPGRRVGPDERMRYRRRSRNLFCGGGPASGVVPRLLPAVDGAESIDALLGLHWQPLGGISIA